MSPLFFVLMGATLPCGFHTEPGRIEVGLYTTFQYAAPPAVREAAGEELGALGTLVGIRVHWRPESDVSADGWWNQIATIQFQGHCDASELRTQPPHPWTLGRTQVSEGKVIPYGEIHCDALRAYLAPTLVSMGRNQRGMVFGRALGRVLAHELYHILAKTKRHGTGGLGRESLTPGELTADEFQFHPQELETLRLAMWSSSRATQPNAAPNLCPKREQ